MQTLQMTQTHKFLMKSMSKHGEYFIWLATLKKPTEFVSVYSHCTFKKIVITQRIIWNIF